MTNTPTRQISNKIRAEFNKNILPKLKIGSSRFDDNFNTVIDPNVSEEFRAMVIDAMLEIYSTEAGRKMIEDYLAGRVEFDPDKYDGNPHQPDGFIYINHHEDIAFAEPPGIVGVDPEFISKIVTIGLDGVSFKETFVSVLAHELVHSLAALDDDYENDENFRGQTDELTNKIRVELGLPETLSYLGKYLAKGTTLPELFGGGNGILVADKDYSFGRHIDRAIVTSDDYDIFEEFDEHGLKMNLNELVVNDESDSRVRLGMGDDVVWGNGGRDTIFGGRGNDILLGNGGRDSLFGGNGEDILKGGEHDDRLNGGLDNDRLVGGEGSDTFIFKDGYDRDTIADFNVDEDILVLREVSSVVDLNDLRAHASLADGGVVIKFSDSDSLLLQDLELADLSQMDVIYQGYVA